MRKPSQGRIHRNCKTFERLCIERTELCCHKHAAHNLHMRPFRCAFFGILLATYANALRVVPPALHL